MDRERDHGGLYEPRVFRVRETNQFAMRAGVECDGVVFRQCSGDVDRHAVVITSYSIHYTKLYEAQTAHIPGNEMAKCVIIKIDGKMAMTVLPASYQVDFGLLREAIGADRNNFV